MINKQRILKRTNKLKEEYTNILSKNDKLEIKMWRKQGRVIKFNITYLRKINNEWKPIKRCDNSHPGGKKRYRGPHCHIFKNNGSKYTEYFSGEPGEFLTAMQKDFSKNYKKILENYFI